MTRADGRSLLKPEGKPGQADYQPSADNSALHARRGQRVADEHGRRLRVGRGPRLVLQPAGHREDRRSWRPAGSCPVHRRTATGTCPRASPTRPTTSCNGVLNVPGATASAGVSGHYAAAKTGTANSGYYAAFAGYTPPLAGYVSVFNPMDPTRAAGCSAPTRVTATCRRRMPTADVRRQRARRDLGGDVPARRPGPGHQLRLPAAPVLRAGYGLGAPKTAPSRPRRGPPGGGGPTPTPAGPAGRKERRRTVR